MPKFCVQCGSPVEENAQFCNKCGARMSSAAPGPAAATAAPPAPAAAPPSSVAAAGPAPLAAAAPASAPQKSSPILKIVLAIVAFFLLVGVLGIGACVYVGYRAKQKFNAMAEEAKHNSFTLGTGPTGIQINPGGGSAGTAPTATADVPVYPGATATNSGGTMSFGSAGAISGQEFETSDSVDQVVSFYKDKLGSKVSITESQGSALINYPTSNGMTMISVTPDTQSGKTKISISRIGK